MEKLRNDFMRQLNWLLIFVGITAFYFNRILEGPITGWSHLLFAMGYLLLGGLTWIVEEVKTVFVFTCFVAFYCLCFAGAEWTGDSSISMPGLGIFTISIFSAGIIVGFWMILDDFIKDRRDLRYRLQQKDS